VIKKINIAELSRKEQMGAIKEGMAAMGVGFGQQGLWVLGSVSKGYGF
jgi:hypothetical protein